MSKALVDVVVGVARAHNGLAAAVEALPELDAIAARLAIARAQINDALGAINDARRLVSPQLIADLDFAEHDLQLARRSIDEIGASIGAKWGPAI